jgi:hypothetical protein
MERLCRLCFDPASTFASPSRLLLTAIGVVVLSATLGIIYSVPVASIDRFRLSFRPVILVSNGRSQFVNMRSNPENDPLGVDITQDPTIAALVE